MCYLSETCFMRFLCFIFFVFLIYVTGLKKVCFVIDYLFHVINILPLTIGVISTRNSTKIWHNNSSWYSWLENNFFENGRTSRISCCGSWYRKSNRNLYYNTLTENVCFSLNLTKINFILCGSIKFLNFCLKGWPYQ